MWERVSNPEGASGGLYNQHLIPQISSRSSSQIHHHSPPFHPFDHRRTLLFHLRDLRNLHKTHSPSYFIMSFIHDHDDIEATASFEAPCFIDHDDAEDKQSFKGRIQDSDLPIFALAGGLGNPSGLPVRHTCLIYAPSSWLTEAIQDAGREMSALRGKGH